MGGGGGVWCFGACGCVHYSGLILKHFHIKVLNYNTEPNVTGKFRLLPMAQISIVSIEKKNSKSSTLMLLFTSAFANANERIGQAHQQGTKPKETKARRIDALLCRLIPPPIHPTLPSQQRRVLGLPVRHKRYGIVIYALTKSSTFFFFFFIMTKSSPS